jgi:hypothetical protein
MPSKNTPLEEFTIEASEETTGEVIRYKFKSM